MQGLLIYNADGTLMEEESLSEDLVRETIKLAKELGKCAAPLPIKHSATATPPNHTWRKLCELLFLSGSIAMWYCTTCSRAVCMLLGFFWRVTHGPFVQPCSSWTNEKIGPCTVLVNGPLSLLGQPPDCRSCVHSKTLADTQPLVPA